MKDTQVTVLPEITLAEVVINYPGSRRVLTRYHLDYCCGGGHSLKSACEAAGLDASSVWKDVVANMHSPLFENYDYSSLPSQQLIEVIKEKHHTYTRQAIPEIQALLSKIAIVHGTTDTHLHPLERSFAALGQELLDHLEIEEQFLFPAISDQLACDELHDSSFQHAVDVPLQAAEEDHEAAGKLLKWIRKATNDFTPPSHACATYKLAYKELQQFEGDLMMHIHLENNVLFARLKKSVT